MELQTAIYTALLHSLWMGLVLAVLTSIIVITTRKRTALLRYNLLATALCLFLLSMGIVFYTSLQQKQVSGTATAQQSSLQNAELIKQPVVADHSILENVAAVFDIWSNYANQIVLIWFLIICAKSTQMMMGIRGVRYLKTTQVFSAGTFWEEKVIEIANKLNISRPVVILQSGLAKVPMIAGHLKPVILIPLGLLNGLATKEVEAIISHELAHLKRNDYLVNLVQNFVEIVFFFNPGVLWISKLIKEERENCCDDLALSCMENKHQYIKALISCQEFSTANPRYAMAITGRKNSLKDRVTRMVFNNNSSLNKMEKTLLSIALISVLIVGTAFTTVRDLVSTNRILTAEEVTLFFGNTPQDPTRRAIKKNNGSLKSTGKQKVQVKSTQSKRDEQIKKSVSADIKRARAEKERYANNVKAYQADVKKYQADVKAQKDDLSSYQADLDKYQADVQKYQADVERYAANTTKYKMPIVPVVPSVPTSLSVPISPLVPVEPKLSTVRAMVNAPISVSINNPYATSYSARTGNSNSGKAKEAKPGDMTDELRKDGLIKDPKNFEYKLNEEGLIIDGVRQPENVHRKYMKFLKNKKGTITTTVSTD